MKVLLVYDSFFGNTEKIARAMADALRSQHDVTIARASDVQPGQLTGVGMLLVGSPTRGFRPTPAVASLLKAIPAGGLQGVKVAAFDTRIALSDINSRIVRFFVGTFGYAAKPILDMLTKKGGEAVSQPEGFFVQDTEGPLKEGELDRAATWARQLA